MINVASALLWGFAAAVVLTAAILASASLGFTRIDMPFILGTMLSPNRDRAKVVGYCVHAAVGCGVAFIYTLFFAALGEATWWLGLTFGAIQGALVCVVVLPLMPGLHPRMVSDSRGPEPTRLLEPPGFLATNYGRYTPAVLIAAHAMFGTILGAFYSLPRP